MTVITPSTFEVEEVDLPWFDGTTRHFVFGRIRVEGLTPDQPITVEVQEIHPDGTFGRESGYPEEQGDKTSPEGTWEEAVPLDNPASTVQVQGSHDFFKFTAAPAS